jgi:hypothetical protein
MPDKPTRAHGGGWKKGRRRNPDGGDWAQTRVALAALLDHHHEPGLVSAAALAQALGVYTKTVTRWLKGATRPPIETQEAIVTWVAEQRARLRLK